MIEVPEVSDVDIAFPARGRALTPAWDDIPARFKADNSLEGKVFDGVFFQGSLPPQVAVTAREGVDETKALRALRVVMTSRDCKHEHKRAGWAMLFHEWFEVTEK